MMRFWNKKTGPTYYSAVNLIKNTNYTTSTLWAHFTAQGVHQHIASIQMGYDEQNNMKVAMVRLKGMSLNWHGPWKEAFSDEVVATIALVGAGNEPRTEIEDYPRSKSKSESKTSVEKV